MRVLLWIVGLAAVAVALVLAARYNQGYVLVVLPPWRVELSLNFALLLAALGFVGLYVAARTVMIAIGMPARVREFQARRTQARAHEAFREALVNFFEGRYGRAEKAAAAAMKAGVSPALSAVMAARAAHGMRAFSA